MPGMDESEEQRDGDDSARGPGSASDAAAEIADLRTKLAAADKARDEMRDLAQRTLADFQNFKARTSKDAQSARRFTVKETAAAVLPAFDNLERALLAESGGGETSSLHEGVRLTLQAFVEGLSKIGVHRVATAGVPFDPSCMEALARIESADHADGVVISEWESGWKMADLMVRPARVSVAVAPKPAADVSSAPPKP